MPAITSAQFGNFLNLTRASRLTGPDFIVNLAQRTSYPFFRLLRGSDPFKFARGGSSIIEAFQASDSGTAGTFSPADPATISFVNTSKTITIPWAFYRSYKAWTDEEYDLHTSGGDFVQVKSFAKMLDQQARTAHVNGLDYTLFAVPDYTNMEGTPTNARTPYSIPAFISEDASRKRPPSSVWNNANVIGLDPSVVTEWDNKRRLYGPVLDDPDTGILKRFDQMMLDIQYQPVPEADGAFMDSNQSDILIFTNNDGYTKVQALCRSNNDRLKSVTDPAIGEIAFDGIPFIHAPQLDVALLDQTGSTYNSQAYPAGKPRFFFINKQHLYPVFLKKNIMYTKPVFQGTLQLPDVNVSWTFSTFNLCMNNRKRHGIVAPQ